MDPCGSTHCWTRPRSGPQVTSGVQATGALLNATRHVEDYITVSDNTRTVHLIAIVIKWHLSLSVQIQNFQHFDKRFAQSHREFYKENSREFPFGNSREFAFIKFPAGIPGICAYRIFKFFFFWNLHSARLQSIAIYGLLLESRTIGLLQYRRSSIVPTTQNIKIYIFNTFCIFRNQHISFTFHKSITACHSCCISQWPK